MSTETDVQNRGNWSRRWRRSREVLGDSLSRFLREDSLTVSASIAYYSLLSVFPLLLLLLGVSGIFIHRYELSGRLAIVLQNYLPIKPDAILRNLVGISRAYGRVGLVSLLLLLWGSSGVFLPLEKALNRAWEVKEERTWIRRRLLALEMAVIFVFLILLSSSLVGVNVYIHRWLLRWSFHFVAPLVEFAYHLLMIGATFSMTLAMFIVLFERLPNRPMQLRQVFPSALLTAILWEGALSLFTLLLPVFNYKQVYGSIAVVVALMTWAYISSTVMLFGAQVSRALYRTLEVAPPAEPAPATLAAPSVGDVR
jgi:YihY family inner membrane protein